MSLTITATDSGGLSASTKFTLQTPGNQPPTGSVSIDDMTPEVNQTLNVRQTLNDPDGLGAISYQWQAGGVTVGRGASYTVTDLDVGSALKVTAFYTDGAGKTESLASVPTQAVTRPVLPTYSLSVNSTAVNEGDTVVVRLATTQLPANSRVAFSLSGTISGADVIGGQMPEAAFYTGTDGTASLRLGLVADSLTEGSETLTLTLSDAPGQSLTLNVADTSRALVNHAPSGSVLIQGQAVVRQTLTANQTLQDADGLGVVTYTWQAGSAVLGKGERYTLKASDAGKTISLVAHYTDGLGTAEQMSSAPTVPVTTVVKPILLQGTAKNDKWQGTVNAEAYDGLGGNDTLSGLTGNDTLYGNSGNDKLDGGVGNDSLDGGDGEDTVLYDRNKNDYKATYDSDSQQWMIEDTDPEGEGSDVLTAIEIIGFADGDVQLVGLSAGW